MAGDARSLPRTCVHGKADEACLAWLAQHRRNLPVAGDATPGNLPHQLVRTLEEAFPLHRTPLRPLPLPASAQAPRPQ